VRAQAERARAAVRAGAHALESAAMARIDPAWDGPPRAAHLLVTYRCNLKCAHCDSWKVRQHGDLSVEQWAQALQGLDSLDVVKVLGGEPFARSDMPELLTLIRRSVRPHLLQLTTNGMLEDRLVDAIERMAWPGLQLRLSVDGLGATHDQQRGSPGSFAVVERTLRRVAALRPRYGFSLGINFALTDRSLPELPAMRRFAAELGASLVPGVNVQPFLVGTQPPEQVRPRVVGLAEPSAARAALMGDPADRPPLGRALATVGAALRRGSVEAAVGGGPQAFPCRELRQLIYVLPNGDLVRCGLDHRPAGNLLRDGLPAIWASPARAALRADVDRCPGCLQASVNILSRAYGGCWSA